MRNRNQNPSQILRVVAGLYLLYLAYKLFREGILQGEMVGGMRIVGIVASAVFFVVGAILSASYIKGMLKPEEVPEETAEDTEAISSAEPGDAAETEEEEEEAGSAEEAEEASADAAAAEGAEEAGEASGGSAEDTAADGQ